ncbi:hypothetical protein G5B30_01845 [Sphingobacterium sp. SGG-5]|uniref:hypothetical protein n=1 Tax=Sphingobacterium sp. SGG-5 TaxID=2710881 RepID=UPI0013EA1943|nr:hypothetical protein [Sphingobacterium sp. SGG-5]NGM60649.1 hypothetical protein [Sphingobacterium sp. SGG-5]
MEVQTSKENKSEIQVRKKDNSKVYFFIIAIVALLLTNVYFYVKFKSSGEKLYTIALQKENLQIEIDRIEAELDNIQREGETMGSEDIVLSEQKVREGIANLRSNLDVANLSEDRLADLKSEVRLLKNSVSDLKVRIEELNLQNELLQKENEELNSTVNSQTDKVQTLERSNRALREKVGVASSIKVSNMVINGVEIKRRGNREIETKARRVDELQIQFSIADNPLATKGNKDIYIRIVDPNGNLIVKEENIFQVNNDDLQYTFKETIRFTNNGEEYEFLWNNNNQGFRKGAYTVLLYADNAIMGRASIVLK